LLSSTRVAALLAAVLLSGCIDFGYVAPRPAPRDGGRPERPDGCVEGPADVLEATLVLHFLSMDVDQHLATVRAGGVIAWVNGSNQNHTATAGAPGADLPVESGGFNSGVVAAGGSSWAHRFCNPRSIEWYCQTHPAQMRGYRIVVE